MAECLAASVHHTCRHVCRGPQYNVVDLTFASPRVGNAAFVRHFAARVKRSWRVHRSDDLVPEVPPGKNYVHVPHAVRVDPEQQEIHLRAAAELRAGSIATGAVRACLTGSRLHCGHCESVELAEQARSRW